VTTDANMRHASRPGLHSRCILRHKQNGPHLPRTQLHPLRLRAHEGAHRWVVDRHGEHAACRFPLFRPSLPDGDTRGRRLDVHRSTHHPLFACVYGTPLAAVATATTTAHTSHSRSRTSALSSGVTDLALQWPGQEHAGWHSRPAAKHGQRAEQQSPGQQHGTKGGSPTGGRGRAVG